MRHLKSLKMLRLDGRFYIFIGKFLYFTTLRTNKMMMNVGAESFFILSQLIAKLMFYN